MVFGFGDEVSAAKVVAEFKKTVKTMQFVAGILPDGTASDYLDAVQVANLATIPGKKELLAKLVGSINAPVSGFVNVLAGNLRGLVTVLQAMQEKKSV